MKTVNLLNDSFDWAFQCNNLTETQAKPKTHLCPHAVEFVELDCVRFPINNLPNWFVDVYVGAIYFT